MSYFKDAFKIKESFRTGKGHSWGEHDTDHFIGTERFFKLGYIAVISTS